MKTMCQIKDKAIGYIGSHVGKLLCFDHNHFFVIITKYQNCFNKPTFQHFCLLPQPDPNYIEYNQVDTLKEKPEIF